MLAARFSRTASNTAGVDIVIAMASLGRTLIFAGLLIAVWWRRSMGCRKPQLIDSNGWRRRLPGDIYVKRGNFTFYFPLMTSIVVSLVLTPLFALLRR